MSDHPQLTFAWWNLHNFAHFDPAQTASKRWPKQRPHYEAKRDRILQVLPQLLNGSFPDLIAVCEITREAASDLVGRLPAGFDLIYPSASLTLDKFQVAVFYRKDIGLTPELPLIPSETKEVTRETRPMLTIHLELPGHIIRFVACHWIGLDVRSSQRARIRLADFVHKDVRKFLGSEGLQPSMVGHIVVLGDLNAEPTSALFELHLEGGRDRQTSRESHWRDAEVGRVKLYNLAWRYLGEQIPHGIGRPLIGGAAGAWYNRERGWKTLDHIIVSGWLLGDPLPCLDEMQTQIATLSILMDDRGRPIPFQPGSFSGVSDHLPLVGRIILSEVSR